MRADKWLWHARFFKTRGRAGDVVSAGHFRLNGRRVRKPGASVRVGDVLTFPQGGAIRVDRIAALSTRRGPASEARALYSDPDPASRTTETAPRSGAFSGKG